MRAFFAIDEDDVVVVDVDDDNEHAKANAWHVTQITAHGVPARVEKRNEINIKHIVRTYPENGFKLLQMELLLQITCLLASTSPPNRLISIRFVFIFERVCAMLCMPLAVFGRIICVKFGKKRTHC